MTLHADFPIHYIKPTLSCQIYRRPKLKSGRTKNDKCKNDKIQNLLNLFIFASVVFCPTRLQVSSSVNFARQNWFLYHVSGSLLVMSRTFFIPSFLYSLFYLFIENFGIRLFNPRRTYNLNAIISFIKLYFSVWPLLFHLLYCISLSGRNFACNVKNVFTSNFFIFAILPKLAKN